MVVDTPPGKKFRYSGRGYTVVQQLLEDVLRKYFSDIVNDILLIPVGMDRSNYEQPLNADHAVNACAGHIESGAVIEGKRNIYPELAAAGLWSTPTDLAKFAIEIMDAFNGKSQKVLSQTMAKEILTIQVEPYGLGFNVTGRGNELTFSHAGANEGFQYILIAYPAKNAGIVIMTNGDKGLSLIVEILLSVANEYSWPNLPKITEKAVIKDIDSDLLNKYTGHYLIPASLLGPNQIVINISKSDNKLIISNTQITRLLKSFLNLN
ncbi:MAG: beta-lactamase family protein [Oligoflexia bacterium]|nr:beta-lactamase family protein [Oligoflexia bacterium]